MNALKHGLYAKKARTQIIDGSSAAVVRGQAEIAVQDPRRALRMLDDVMNEIVRRMRDATPENFARLANSLSLAVRVSMSGHRTVRYLMGDQGPLEQALKELEGLAFEED